MTDSKPSKSAKKREHLALQQLGERMIGLQDPELDSLPLDERLREAVREAATMRSRSALRRQKQYIGRLMRTADTAAILEALERREAGDVADRRRFADAERWRDRIVADGAPGLAGFDAETGTHDEVLHELERDLRNTPDGRRGKTLRRRIFRRVHEILAHRS
ncbi:MAG: ribosome biogenesis factor YjgA [Woeseiaceae bacterium]